MTGHTLTQEPVGHRGLDKRLGKVIVSGRVQEENELTSKPPRLYNTIIYVVVHKICKNQAFSPQLVNTTVFLI